MKEQLKKALLASDRLKALQLFDGVEAGNQNIDSTIAVLTSVMAELGEAWEKGDIALAQIYMSSRICEDILDIVLPKSATSEALSKNIAIVTFMDFHFLGRRILSSCLRSGGFSFMDFAGISDAATLVDKTIEHKIDFLLISTLMYHSAIKIKDVTRIFAERQYKVKILVGGAPFIFDSQLWHEVGADAMGIAASDAVNTLKNWIGEKS